MDEIREMIGVFSRKGHRKIETLSGDKVTGKKDNLYSQYYQGIKSGVFKNDEDAAKALLNRKPDSKAFQMIKSRVKRRLMNNLFFLENKGSKIAKAYYACNRDWFSAKFLIVNGAMETGYKLLRSTYSRAVKFQFYGLLVPILRLLKVQSAFMGLHSDFRQYSKALEEVIPLNDAEMKLEGIFLELSLHFQKKMNPEIDFAEKSNEWISEVEELFAKYPTHENTLYYYRILILYYWGTYKFESVLYSATRAQDYLLNHPELSSQVRLAEFALQKLSACLALKDFYRGTLIAKECIALFKEGSTNWLVSQEYHFQLGMQTGNYAASKSIFEDVTSSKAFSNASELLHERWLIFGAFLHYMGYAPKQSGTEKFNFYKFINQVPHYSHDKKGFNVSILVLPVLFLLNEGRFKEVIDRTESLRIYSSRYLKGEDSARSKLFIKMLSLIDKNNFKPAQIRKAGLKYCEQLKTTPHLASGQSDLEIVPPEILWETVLKNLEKIEAARD